jgi:hypothetical protein
MCGHALSDHDKNVRFEWPDPVRFSELKENTPGTWLSHADACTSVDYADLALDGFLANNVPPWKVFEAPVQLRVRNVDHTPYCVSSDDELLESVLSTVWPHDDILDVLPD